MALQRTERLRQILERAQERERERERQSPSPSLNQSLSGRSFRSPQTPAGRRHPTLFLQRIYTSHVGVCVLAKRTPLNDWRAMHRCLILCAVWRGTNRTGVRLSGFSRLPHTCSPAAACPTCVACQMTVGCCRCIRHCATSRRTE